jgi:TIR domain
MVENRAQADFDSFRENISIFISHSIEDTDSAVSLHKNLQDNGFINSWTFEKKLPYSTDVTKEIEKNIIKSRFFILVATESARKSDWVCRELGLALKLADSNAGFQPIIFTFVPSTASSSARSKEEDDKIRFGSFYYKDFSTGELVGEYTVSEKRAFAEGSNADIISDLIDQMTPTIKRIGVDIRSEAELDDTRFFELYTSMFPEEERAPKEQLISTLFYRRRKEVKLPKTSIRSKLFTSKNNRYLYHHETHATALIIGGIAIGLSWCTFDHETKYLFGSWIAIQSCWRSYDIARIYMDWLEKSVCSTFQNHKGLIFDVEPVDFKRAERLISKLEKIAENDKLRGDHKSVIVDTLDQEDAYEVRKLRRIMLYEHKGALLFTNSRARPLDYFQPCLNIEKSISQWQKDKCVLWLMFYPLGSVSDPGRPKQMWKDAVNLIAVELIGKTYAMDRPAFGEKYLIYTRSRRDEALKKSRFKRISLEKIIKSDEISNLISRWRRLGIKLPL